MYVKYTLDSHILSGAVQLLRSIVGHICDIHPVGVLHPLQDSCADLCAAQLIMWIFRCSLYCDFNTASYSYKMWIGLSFVCVKWYIWRFQIIHWINLSLSSPSFLTRDICNLFILLDLPWLCHVRTWTLWHYFHCHVSLSRYPFSYRSKFLATGFHSQTVYILITEIL